MLAYHFPPVGGGGVQRSVKFVRYLPELGWRPLVVTGPGKARDRWTPDDETLASEVSGDVEVRRVSGPVPPLSRDGWPGRIDRLTLRTLPFDAWWAAGAADVAAGVSGVDVVYASMSPFSTAGAAAEAARRLGVPWVADLRDPWALDEVMIFPSALHRRRELRRMERSLEEASRIVFNTQEAARAASAAFPRLAPRIVGAIPNGFDAADFAGAAPERSGRPFRIVHTGYLHTGIGLEHRRTARVRRLLGGDAARVDLLTRSHFFLIQALDMLLREDPTASFELHLAGILSAADKQVADRPYVRLHGYLPHRESVELLRSADLLFLPMQRLAPGTRATIVPAKTYEYLAAGVPILAAVPPGDAKDLLCAAGNAVVVEPDDVAAMTAAVRDRLAAATAEPAPPRPEVLAPYERRVLTQRLAAVLDDAAASR